MLFRVCGIAVWLVGGCGSFVALCLAVICDFTPGLDAGFWCFGFCF